MKMQVPSSKSITQRALIISALTEGGSTLINPLLSDDTQYLINALKNYHKDFPIFLGNAGTAVRFMTAFLTLTNCRRTIIGDERMSKRPIQNLVDALNTLGASVKCENGYPPITVDGRESLKGGKVLMEGSLSSQYVSAILMIAPYALKDVEIKIIGNLTSKPYVDLTISVMKSFGVEVVNENYKKFTIKSGQQYKPRKFKIEGDASSATYFWAISHLMKTPIEITNLNPRSKQGDIKFKKLIKHLPHRIDLNSMPDTVPLAAILASIKKEKTLITNIANLRVKECDRIDIMQKELNKIGIVTKSGEDWLEIHGGIREEATNVEIDPHDDHRIAMSFAVLASRFPKLKILNKNCVKKSYPNFWKDFKKAIK